MKKRVNITDIHKNMIEKHVKTSESYERVYDLVMKRIYKSSQEKKLNYFYEIPEYIWGYPLFNLDICIRFLYTELTNNGFLVKYYFPKFLYISWNFDEIKYENSRENTRCQVPYYRRPELPHYHKPLALPLYDPEKKYIESEHKINNKQPDKQPHKPFYSNEFNDNLLPFLSSDIDKNEKKKKGMCLSKNGKYSLNFC